MLHTRYEEYGRLTDQLPCVFTPGLKRTKAICSQLSNWHENLEIQLCTEGSGYVLLDGVRHLIQEGDIVAVNSNVVHYTGTETSLTYSCLIIDSGFCRAAGFDHTKLQFESLFQDNTISNLFAEITRLTGSYDDTCRHARLQIALLEILIALREHHTVCEHSVLQTNRTFENIRHTIQFIRENYEKTLSLDDLAKNVMTDKYSLSRSFKALTGQTIVQYMNNYRCMRAIELIRDGALIQEAALLCGFHNMSFFTRTFQQYTGQLPSRYKNDTERR